MTLPTHAKTWTISANNYIPFVSLADLTQKFLWGIKNFLVSNGYAVKGSCSNGTGAMDATDRWTTAADVTPRGATAGESMAWLVLTDGNGANILLAWQGATDDESRISFSPSGTYALSRPDSASWGTWGGFYNYEPSHSWSSMNDAYLLEKGFAVGMTFTTSGWPDDTNPSPPPATIPCTMMGGTIWTIATVNNSSLTTVELNHGHTGDYVPGTNILAVDTYPTHRPQSNDDRSLYWGTTSGQYSYVDATGSLARVWHGWVDITHKLCRFCIARNGEALNIFGIEEVTPAAELGGTVTFSPPMWGFFYQGGGYSSSTAISGGPYSSYGGTSRVTVGVTAYNITLGGTAEYAYGNWNSGAPKLLQLNGKYPLTQLGLVSQTAGARGKIGTRIDWWEGGDPDDGQMYVGRTLIHVSGCAVWPWDGSTVAAYK